MANLTKKELSYLKESINLLQNHEKFFKTCAQTAVDPEVSSICNVLADEKMECITTLKSYIQ